MLDRQAIIHPLSRLYNRPMGRKFFGNGIILKTSAMPFRPYRGRFAPSPTGPLHRGSLAAALASWLDARAHDGKWLIRIEGIDPPRERPGAAQQQLAVLAALGMQADEPVLYQSTRSTAYEQALDQLRAAGRTYYCDCTRALRAQLAGTQSPAGAAPDYYPGTCRDRAVAAPAAVRFRVPPGEIVFHDRVRGPCRQDVARFVGDPIIRRADGYWAYQLAVVVDDAHQGITDVVRGADLLDNTPRQILLQSALGLPRPRYLHIELVRDAHGRKLSKSDDEAPIAAGSAAQALAALEQAWGHLGFAPTDAATLAQFQRLAIEGWRRRSLAHADISADADADADAAGAAAPAAGRVQETT